MEAYGAHGSATVAYGYARMHTDAHAHACILGTRHKEQGTEFILRILYLPYDLHVLYILSYCTCCTYCTVHTSGNDDKMYAQGSLGQHPGALKEISCTTMHTFRVTD